MRKLLALVLLPIAVSAVRAQSLPRPVTAERAVSDVVRLGAAGDQSIVGVATNGDIALVVWIDNRQSGTYPLYAARVDAQGNVLDPLGVRISCGHRVEDLAAERREGGFDAAFVAVGAHLSKRVDIPAKDAGPIVDAVSFLRSVASGERPVIGRRVAVYGGGNTAIDVARTAKRLGATEAVIVYRRTRERMPAHDFEVEEALEEGVLVKWLSTIKQVGEGTLAIERMELDEKGNPCPTGIFVTLAAGSVVLALGQDVDLSLLDGVPVDMVTLSPVEVAVPVNLQLAMLVIGSLGTGAALALFFQQDVPPKRAI